MNSVIKHYGSLTLLEDPLPKTEHILTFPELHAILQQDPRDYSKGGFQQFMCDVRYRVVSDGSTFTIRLDDGLLERARQYQKGQGGFLPIRLDDGLLERARQYQKGQGGFQGRIMKALGRFL